MNNKTAFALILFAFAFQIHAQNIDYAWTVALGSTGIDDGKGITTDGNLNVYAVGSFKGTVDFDPGPNVSSLTAIGTGSGYLVKYDAGGNFQWVLQISGSVSASSTSVCMDNSDNVYIIGEVNGISGDFDPGPAFQSITSAGLTDVYIAKYTSAGQFVWLNQFGGTANEYARKIKAGKNDELVITCNFEGTVDFDPGPGTNIITSAGSSDVFIARFKTSGNLDWVRTIGNSGGNTAPGIGIDEFGGIYSVGSFTGTLDTDPDTLIANYLTVSAPASDGVIIKLDSTGTFQWSHNMSSNSAVEINDVEPDGDNNIYITGWYSGFVDFDPSAGLDTFTNISGIDVFAWKMNYSGNHIWVKIAGNTMPEFYDGRSISIDKNGNLFILGIFEGSADFNPDTGLNIETSLGDFDTFIWGLNANGNYIFSKSVGGTGKDVSISLHIDKVNNLYFTGFFNAQVDFNPWSGTNVFTAASSVADIHINKWSNCIANGSTVTENSCDDFFIFNGQTYTNSGTYTQTYLNSAGCDSIVTLQLTLADIDTATAVTGSTISALQIGASFQWYTCNGSWLPISNATQQSFTATQNGNYAVVISRLGCSDTSSCINILNVSLNQLPENNFCKIYPNPSSGFVYINWSFANMHATILIYNSIGQLLQQVYSAGDLQTKIDLNVPPGSYLIKIRTEKGEVFIPLVNY
jgi:hypothetical protein